jgi:hypothetical protein
VRPTAGKNRPFFAGKKINRESLAFERRAFSIYAERKFKMHQTMKLLRANRKRSRKTRPRALAQGPVCLLLRFTAFHHLSRKSCA